MIGIVWYSKKENGVKQFEQIIQDYQKVGIMPCSRTKDQVIFNNEDRWYLVKLEDGCCVRRCNVSYIDCEIYDAAIDAVAQPATSLPPFNAIRYY